MRAFGRDLIRGGHYGQRSCEPHLKAEHMAAPTNAAYVKKALANSEPSTHGTSCCSGTSCCHPGPRLKPAISWAISELASFSVAAWPSRASAALYSAASY